MTSGIHWTSSTSFQPLVRKVQAFAALRVFTTHQFELWTLHALLQVSPDNTVQCRNQNEVCFRETLTNMPHFGNTNIKLKQSL